MSADFQGIGMTSQRSRNRLVTQLREMGIQSEAVLGAIGNTPRHIFVDEALASRAYDNTALPIGHNQTISQPYIVARMTEALLQQGGQNEDKDDADEQRVDRRDAQAGGLQQVLEVGTGCGYQTVILAQFAAQVYSIERIDALLNRARERFHALKYRNIKAKYGDGKLGWAEYGPFDGILVAAAPVGVPQRLLQQLSIGGRLVIPVGHSGEQQLLRIQRTEDGFAEQRLDWVSFVPMLDGRG